MSGAKQQFGPPPLVGPNSTLYLRQRLGICPITPKNCLSVPLWPGICAITPRKFVRLRHSASLLVGEQDKNPGDNHQGDQKTDNERQQRMPTALEPPGLGALLSCSNAKPEWKIAHCPRSSRRRSSSDRSIGVGVRSRVRCHPCLATCVSFPTSYVLLVSLHDNPDSDIVLYRYHCISDGPG
jgi:hypothetical protein